MGNIVQFPRRNKGRIRKTSSANAEGMWAIHQFGWGDRCNIEIFNEHRFSQVDRSDFLAYFLQTVMNSLPKETRRAVRVRAWCEATMGKSDHERIVAANLASMFRRPHDVD